MMVDELIDEHELDAEMHFPLQQRWLEVLQHRPSQHSWFTLQQSWPLLPLQHCDAKSQHDAFGKPEAGGQHAADDAQHQSLLRLAPGQHYG
jgi:hypothetical protein